MISIGSIFFCLLESKNNYETKGGKLTERTHMSSSSLRSYSSSRRQAVLPCSPDGERIYFPEFKDSILDTLILMAQEYLFYTRSVISEENDAKYHHMMNQLVGSISVSDLESFYRQALHCTSRYPFLKSLLHLPQTVLSEDEHLNISPTKELHTPNGALSVIALDGRVLASPNVFTQVNDVAPQSDIMYVLAEQLTKETSYRPLLSQMHSPLYVCPESRLYATYIAPNRLVYQGEGVQTVSQTYSLPRYARDNGYTMYDLIYSLIDADVPMSFVAKYSGAEAAESKTVEVPAFKYTDAEEDEVAQTSGGPKTYIIDQYLEDCADAVLAELLMDTYNESEIEEITVTYTITAQHEGPRQWMTFPQLITYFHLDGQRNEEHIMRHLYFWFLYNQFSDHDIEQIALFTRNLSRSIMPLVVDDLASPQGSRHKRSRDDDGTPVHARRRVDELEEGEVVDEDALTPARVNPVVEQFAEDDRDQEYEYEHDRDQDYEYATPTDPAQVDGLEVYVPNVRQLRLAREQEEEEGEETTLAERMALRDPIDVILRRTPEMPPPRKRGYMNAGYYDRQISDEKLVRTRQHAAAPFPSLKVPFGGELVVPLYVTSSGDTRLTEPQLIAKFHNMKISFRIDPETNDRERLGRGGFGSIFRICSMGDCEYILKAFRHVGDGNQTKLFYATYEASCHVIARQLAPKYVVDIYDIFSIDQISTYILYQKADISAQHYLDSVLRGQLNGTIADMPVYMLEKIFDAFHQCGKRGLIHLDGRPGNFLMSGIHYLDDERTMFDVDKVLMNDWGIAVVYDIENENFLHFSDSAINDFWDFICDPHQTSYAEVISESLRDIALRYGIDIGNRTGRFETSESEQEYVIALLLSELDYLKDLFHELRTVRQYTEYQLFLQLSAYLFIMLFFCSGRTDGNKDALLELINNTLTKRPEDGGPVYEFQSDNFFYQCVQTACDLVFTSTDRIERQRSRAHTCVAESIAMMILILINSMVLETMNRRMNIVAQMV